MAVYYGYSSIGKRSGSTILTDKDLARRDLLNHFYTRRGERVMQPEFGCIIWDLLFEPLDDYTKTLANEEVERIINSDPRWEIDNIFLLTDDQHSIEVRANIIYTPTNTAEELFLTFESEAD